MFATAIVEFGDEAVHQPSDVVQRLGRFSGVAVVLSVVVCYGTLALVMLLALVGVTMTINEGAWATAIVVFAWIAVLAMGVNMQRHRSFAPVMVAGIGALLISWVMFADYSRTIEIFGFALLIVAAIRDRRLRGRRPVPTPNLNQGA